MLKRELFMSIPVVVVVVVIILVITGSCSDLLLEPLRLPPLQMQSIIESVVQYDEAHPLSQCRSSEGFASDSVLL